eukprot:TRINITY_DN22658_c0_g1_i1.p1 TRINITY_DN22658_c0_g1~~TRINITY_DN22658_c0_g1_i1.p1  ORF type:complete len:213 (+),score=49.92 TRINITY_DN22658_c0_g1_i1:79-639(+)
MAEDTREVELYGGAISCDLPRSFSDASNFREVPDHQEVWVDTCSDRSLMIEILESKDVTDDEAISFFLSDLAAFNAAVDPTVVERRVLAAEEVPHLPPEVRCLHGVGEQTIAKFKEVRGNRVRIHAAALRLQHQSTDILITLNDPVAIDPESSSASAPAADSRAEAIFSSVLRSFRIVDWNLFGEA